MAPRQIPVAYTWTEVDVVDRETGVARRCMAMVPLERFSNICGRQFDPGEEYTLEQHEERSMASHRHYFAAVKEAWGNLPEKLTRRFPTPEHLRKWCLVQCDWYDEKQFECPSESFARRLGYFIRTEDEYAVISFHPIEGTKQVTTIVRRAKSQSMQAMGKQKFEESKRAVLDLISSFIGVSRGDLNKNAGRSA